MPPGVYFMATPLYIPINNKLTNFEQEIVKSKEPCSNDIDSESKDGDIEHYGKLRIF